MVLIAAELCIGSELVDNNGNTLLVEQMFLEELHDETVDVYNFQVEDFHTYHVGNNMVLVHNATDLYARGKFRKSTHKKMKAEAQKDADGDMICPTCGKKIPETYIDKSGRTQIGYDRDHYPTTWNERVQAMKAQPIPPTRKEVITISIKMQEFNVKIVIVVESMKEVMQNGFRRSITKSL